jgi:hypothetical protein
LSVLDPAREACLFCVQPRNLRRTLPITLVVGLVLTAINQGARSPRAMRRPLPGFAAG